VPASDRSLLVIAGEGISIAVNSRIHRLARHMGGVAGVTSQSPAYASLLIRFDPLRLTHQQLEETVLQADLNATEAEEFRIVEIAVRYEGPDLVDVAERHGLTAGQVIEAHASTLYHAYFAGFVPGFVYLGEVPGTIATPRRASPRKAVPAGSVGIAGTQTGVYPVSTPGGWNLIGRTEAVMFDAERGAALVEPGDKVRFVPQ
jgi:KipI family sensor histidine kinase inhibitor